MFFSRDGTTVNWNGKTQGVAAALRDCETHSFYPVRNTILRLKESLTRKDWTSFYSDKEIMRLFDKQQCPTEVTGPISSDEDDKVQFKLRKRKGVLGVPKLSKRLRFESKRILGKVTATPDSCLPTTTLDITEPVTSWGRGHSATIRYTNTDETRIPKYAFKIFLFKRGFYDGKRSSTQGTNVWTEMDRDMTFYISSKASLGIWINDTKLCSFDRQNPFTESKYWGELRHLDYITVWFNNHKESEYTRFQFECFWGKSMEPRKEEDEFKILEEGSLLDEIERNCLVEEREILKRRESEELVSFT